MANILNQFARAVLTMNGMPAAEVTRRARELKRGEKPQKPLPKAKVGKPPSAAKPPAPTPATKSPTSPLTRSSAPSGRRTRVQGRVVPGGRAPSTNVDKPAPKPPAARATTTPARVSSTQPAAPAPRWTDSTTRPPAPKPPAQKPAPVPRWTDSTTRPPAQPAKPAPVPRWTDSTTRTPTAAAKPPAASSPLTRPTAPSGRRTRVQGTVVPGGRPVSTNVDKPTPKPTAAKPPAAKPPAPTPATKPGEPINVRGQTNLFNAKGNPRDFRNPSVAARRPPTVTPVSTRSGAPATPPNVRPNRVSPGQLETSSQVGVGNGRPVRGSMGTVSGPATSPKPPNGRGTGVRRPSIGNVSGPATSPKPQNGRGNSGGASATQAVTSGSARGLARRVLGGLGSVLGAAGSTGMLIDGSNMVLDKLKGSGVVYDPKKDSRVTPRPKQGDYQSRFAGARDAAFTKAQGINPTGSSKPPAPSGDTNPPNTTSRPPAAASRPQSGGSGNTQRGAGTSAAPSSAPATSRPTSRPSSAPAPQPAAPKPTYQSPAQPTSAIKTPSGSQQDGTGDYKGPETPASRKTVKAVDRPSRGPTGRDEMVQYNIDRAKRKRS